jgi:hypothetical protein
VYGGRRCNNVTADTLQAAVAELRQSSAQRFTAWLIDNRHDRVDQPPSDTFLIAYRGGIGGRADCAPRPTEGRTLEASQSRQLLRVRPHRAQCR